VKRSGTILLILALAWGGLFGPAPAIAESASAGAKSNSAIFPKAIAEGVRKRTSNERRRLSLLQREPIVGSLETPLRLPADSLAWRDSGLGTVRGMTLGPIESGLQPGRGYGSAPFADTLGEVSRLGSNWISLTVFGRVWDLESAGVDLNFEQPSEVTRDAVIRSVQMAHERGLRVLLVPHLWVESGGWRAEIKPGSDARFSKWAASYEQFALYWADAAEEAGVDLLACGVELRSWVTTARAPSFVHLIQRIRSRFGGLLTYAANWDDVDDTVIWGHLDVIGVNAFYRLHWEDDATWQQLEAGGHEVARTVKELSERYERPVVFTEFGYTTRKNTAIKPWLWPEQLGKVEVDQGEQARAYAALLGGMKRVPGFAGAFVWRMYADVSDMSQEAEWGFSPWGKESEVVLRGTFRDPNFGDPPF
jgi:hypothetical protein